MIGNQERSLWRDRLGQLGPSFDQRGCNVVYATLYPFAAYSIVRRRLVDSTEAVQHKQLPQTIQRLVRSQDERVINGSSCREHLAIEIVDRQPLVLGALSDYRRCPVTVKEIGVIMDLTRSLLSDRFRPRNRWKTRS